MSDIPEPFVPRGLPEPLPEGETIIWQGGPASGALARHALHGRLVALYFAAVAVFVAGIAWSDGRPLFRTLTSLALIGTACLVVQGLIRLYAFLIASSAIYTITNRRVVMRIGVAFPLTLNIPFAIVEGAGLRTDPDGTGDIPLRLGGSGRMGYVHLWPHARPWRVGSPEPMLRGVPDAAQVAAILARALGSGPLGQAAASRAETVNPTAQTALPSAAA